MPSVNIYRVGDRPVMSALFSDPARTTPPIDPATGHTLVNPSGGVTCTLTLPDGSTLPLAVTVSGALYTARVVVTMPGTTKYQFVASGDFVGTATGVFQVRP